MSPKELIEVGNLVISKLEENPNYANEIIAQHLAVGEELLSTCRNIHNQNLKKKSKKELCKLLINYFKTFEKFSGYHILPVSLEKQMAKKVREYLERKTSDVNDKLIALSTPIKETDNTREKRDLLKIVIYAKKNNSPAEDKQILELLKKHKEKHEWMAVAHKYTPYPLEHYISELKKELSKNPEEELEKLNNRPDEVEEERNKILSELNLPKNIKLIIDTLREFTFMRDFKRNTGYRSHYYMQNMWLEIGRRAKISVEEVKFCTPNELIEFLLGKKKLNKEISHERKKYHIIVVLNGKMKLLMGKEAKEFEKAQIGEEKVEKVDSLKGMPACKGYAKGRVKIVLKPEEITKVEKGDILVAVNTEPAMVPAMERAAAIVTDEGGITCHAAIVSREMGKPCVIGTKVATQVLKDGDMVEVDAEKGIIRKIS
ncbi:hypothetical protein HQ533_04990 [Candidatus Woesearchaeota archaeon]|nr:hypothetical protein [Candidatus Woesearchaeota archaeon]